MPAITEDRYLVTCGWDDVPHLTQRQKTKMLNETPPHLRDARSKGTPSLGSGAIYPIPESEIVVQPFAIPPYWKRGFGLDVGWNRTACIWGAHDTSVDMLYLYTEHYQGNQPAPVHATAIRARGDWIPGVIDPAAEGRNQVDGTSLMSIYVNHGLKLSHADNSVEAGILEVWQRLATGRLKVFSTCLNWLAEYRLYRRNEKGAIVKKNDHLMDATRYLVMSGLGRMAVKPAATMTGVMDHEIADTTAGY